jgi:RimJ/RimL family protein N-acetyltransferase
VKARVGGASDDPEDLDLPYWAGVIPLRLTPGRPRPDAGVRTPLPAYLESHGSAYLRSPRLCGEHVILEPLAMSHVNELFDAIGDDAVYEFLGRPAPATVDDVATLVSEALTAHDAGVRVPFAQRSTTTGRVIGTTSYYALDPVNRSLAIGHTMLARSAWRTGANTETKLMLLSRAFDELGAVRVEWHTDVLNLRSQAAIERLGAVREAVLHRHRLRANGTFRDTVLYAMTDEQWPAAYAALRDRLRPVELVSAPVLRSRG